MLNLKKLNRKRLLQLRRQLRLMLQPLLLLRRKKMLKSRVTQKAAEDAEVGTEA